MGESVAEDFHESERNHSIDSSGSGSIMEFKHWLASHGARLHPLVSFRADSSGHSVIAAQDLPSDTTVVSCPFDLAITPDVSRRALASLLGLASSSAGDDWSERQLICTYISLHWIVGESNATDVLAHRPYLTTLPSADRLRTPLHFTHAELEAFRGSNIYGATLDRRRDWQSEWRQCQELVSACKPAWGGEFTWERYLTAATYLSSRAFPSTLLSSQPSLAPTPSSHPVLLPGIDCLNHARAHPVSWVVSNASPTDARSGQASTISLVLHTSTPRGAEVFNNYGPKPNAELILGYGFTLPHNPDDTIVLRIGGNPAGGGGLQPRFEVGRDAQGAEPVWETVLSIICEDPQQRSVEDELDAANMLADMAKNLYNRLPQTPKAGEDIRPEVVLMIEHYLEGQRDILLSLVGVAREKERQAIRQAREQGLQIVEEEDDEEE